MCENICSEPRQDNFNKTFAPGIYSTRLYKVTKPKQKLKQCLGLLGKFADSFAPNLAVQHHRKHQTKNLEIKKKETGLMWNLKNNREKTETVY